MADKSGRTLPFPIGKYSGTPSGTNTDLDYLLGSEYTVEYKSTNSAAGQAPYNGFLKRVRLVKNDTTVSLLPKRLAQFETEDGTKAAGTFGTLVKGYSRTTNVKCYPIDEKLPSTGVPAGCYFYVVVHGPALCVTGFTDMASDIVVGDVLAAFTATTSSITGGTTLGGRVAKQAITIHSAGTTGYQDHLEGRHAIGMALSAVLTTGTNADMLVNVGEY